MLIIQKYSILYSPCHPCLNYRLPLVDHLIHTIDKVFMSRFAIGNNQYVYGIHRWATSGFENGTSLPCKTLLTACICLLYHSLHL